MKHAKIRNKYIDKFSLKFETNEQIDGEKKDKKDKSLRCIINFIIFFFIIYFYNSCVKNHSQATSSIEIVIVFFFVMVSIFLVVGVNYILSREYKLEKLFLIIMIPTSITYSLILIPGMVPDEATHMCLTYSLASQIMGIEDGKITLRGEEKYIYENLPQSPDRNSYNYSYTHLMSGEDNSKYVTIDVNSANWKQIFWYFPAVIGTIIARSLHFGATPTLYLARLFNLVFYLWLTYFSIKKIPIGKQLLFMIAILPMCSQQMMSLSYDAILNAASFFCLAYGLFFVYHSEMVKYDEYLKYLFSAVLILSIKSAIYSFLLIIPILAKFNNINGNIRLERKHKIIIVLSISIFILLLNFVSFDATASKNVVDSTAVSKHIISWSGTEGYSIMWLIKHPIDGIILFINTISIKAEWYYYSCLGQDLSWFTVKLSYILFKFWGVLLIASALKKESNEIDNRTRILMVCINCIIFFLILLSMCIYWTPLDFDHIEGVQGRYFIPIIYTMLIIFNNKKIYIREKFYKYVNIIACFLVAFTIINLINVCYL